MNRRIQQFLELEDLTPAKLSEILGIQRSGLSHILAGRNKPSFDFIERMLTKFPNLSAEWLITGKGKPYKDQNSFFSTQSPTPQIETQASENKLVESRNANSQPHENGLFDSNLDNELSLFSPSNVINEVQEHIKQSEQIKFDDKRNAQPSEKTQSTQTSPVTVQPITKISNPNRVIRRITVFYSDGTFEER